MVRASMRPDGKTAPVASGFSSTEQENAPHRSAEPSSRRERQLARAWDRSDFEYDKLNKAGLTTGIAPGAQGQALGRAGAGPHGIEELFDSGEKSRGFGLSFLRRELFKFAQQFLLLLA